ncbi:MAG: GMC family oxidoreductase [Pseudonocardia sp.]|uniref:GMC family oxidoreductase n=1 Tax=Pseudonocardia sp. TaxID=60912 RepID=UPI001ACEE625|nr:GMC family oxidoreductase [Pseudonocardia sp.]MBN9099964.1 GMC family oxidoreductase [Pseudonocardia sp.]
MSGWNTNGHTGRNGTNGTRGEEADVLIIGSGMSGSAMANRLCAAGFKVTMLEQGDWIHPTEYAHHHQEFDIERNRGWSYDPNVRQGPEDYPVTGFTTPYLMNAVGGSTLRYAAHWPRLKPIDFRKGTELGNMAGNIDWPISYEELAPYYDINDAEVGISGVHGDPSYPDRPGAPRQQPVPPGKLGMKFASGLDKLGWHWWPSDNGILTEAKDGRLPCNNCGNCLCGCPRGSLAGMDVALLPKALANGLDLRINARVSRVEAKGGKATGAEYIDRITGESHFVGAKIVVVAASGIGTPRLLLMSEQKGHPDGLANANGLVGTHLMHHSFAFVDCWFDDPIEGFKGAFGAPLACQEFYHTDTSRGFVNGLMMQVGRSFGSAYTAMGTHTAAVAPWGQDHRAFFDSHFAHHLLVFMFGEDLPIRENRVTLDRSVTDSSGLPAAHVEFNVSENDRRLCDFGVERITEVADALGARETNHTGVLSPPPGWHLMGTARMGNTPEDSTVNRYNQAWEVPNLFIADGAAMTTGGAVNPTSTIGAMSTRAAEYIKQNFAEIVAQSTTPSNALAPAL